MRIRDVESIPRGRTDGPRGFPATGAIFERGGPRQTSRCLTGQAPAALFDGLLSLLLDGDWLESPPASLLWSGLRLSVT